MKKFIFSLIAVFMSSILLAAPTFAMCTEEQEKNGCVSTSILGNGCSCDDGTGSSVMDILDLVVNILSACVGILGVIGIVVVGIQYLTAGGSEEKVKKSKRRMFEIIIGLVVYAILFAGLKWLLPSFSNSTTTTTTPTTPPASEQQTDTNGYTYESCVAAGKEWNDAGYCKTY